MIWSFSCFVFAVSGCASISVFVSLFGTPVGITGSGEGIKVCALIARIKKYEPVIKKKRSEII